MAEERAEEREPGSGALGNPLLGGARLVVYLLWTLLLVPVQALAVALNWPLRQGLPRFYHRICASIIGFDVVVRGQRAAPGPVLFIANHSSYLDIVVLGSVIPGSFVAKSEVAGWPFFGLLAKLQETVFVERKARHGVERQRDDIGARLEAGDNLILFPEGTSSDGNRTLPFKTALFAVASRKVKDQPMVIQPVSVTATRLDGIPMGIAYRPYYAWYGDMDLAPHLWTVFTLGRITVEVEFHPPVTIEGFSSRKAMAEHCQRVVAAGVERAITGRASEPLAVAPAEVPAAVQTQPAGA